MGYHRAGFRVIGVDIEPQPRYPFEFIQADALKFIAEHGKRFDVIHASPPCQGYSVTNSLPQCQDRDYPKLLEEVRELLISTGKPYIIENVIGAPLVDSVMLCGLMFGLKVFRHRRFESNLFLMAMSHISHRGKEIGKGGFCCVAGHGDSNRGKVDPYHRRKSTWEAAMGINWMTKEELTQAIPPAYTEYLGLQLHRWL